MSTHRVPGSGVTLTTRFGIGLGTTGTALGYPSAPYRGISSVEEDRPEPSAVVASDFMERFVEYAKERGVDEKTLLAAPTRLFTLFLCVRGIEQDGEKDDDVRAKLDAELKLLRLPCCEAVSQML